MNKNEAIISSAYTGILFPGIEFRDVYKAIEEKLNRPVFTHELGDDKVTEEIKEAFKPDFIAIEVTEE